MFESTRTMHEIVTDDPAFGEFLVSKGFPFSLNNPIVKLVTFDDVAKLRKLDKETFLAEYDAWRARNGEGVAGSEAAESAVENTPEK